MVKRLSLILCLVLLNSIQFYAQSVFYQLVESEKISSSVVKLSLKVYGKNKKTIDADAQYAAIRVALFDGCPNTMYNKPLLDDGETTSFEQYPSYFDGLYNYRLSDFIASCIAVSKFKGADKKKGTLYEIQVKVLQLKKDLEKNGIKNKIGI
ncbi:hypothetical protein [Bacteroides sp.]|uniref:hypothetical protein n=1 Tax=Bacteroides sp. TaxID=29523 RepID=UPI0023C2EE51|nr:hypothetical protein [Bacteroides sp.]MDE6216039.1 hypothetical protein [Bacteroides sp.]